MISGVALEGNEDEEVSFGCARHDCGFGHLYLRILEVGSA